MLELNYRQCGSPTLSREIHIPGHGEGFIDDELFDEWKASGFTRHVLFDLRLGIFVAERLQ